MSVTPLASCFLAPSALALLDPAALRALLRLATQGDALAWVGLALLAMAPLALAGLPWTRASLEDCSHTLRTALAWLRETMAAMEPSQAADPWANSPVRTPRST